MFKRKNKLQQEEGYAKIFQSTFGQLSLGAFLICAVSGVILAIPFDVSKPYESISYLLIANPAASLFRKIHYWSAQFFLLSSIFHLIDHLRLSTEKNIKSGIWYRLTLALFVIVFVMLSGFILKGDAESLQAHRIFDSLLKQIPFIGKTISFTLLGAESNFQLLYVHHIATATIFLWITIIEHSRIIWPKLSHVLYLLLTVTLLGYWFPPALHDNLNMIIKGPWYLVGLQELFHWVNNPAYILAFLFLVLFLLIILQRFDGKSALLVKKNILLIFVVYCLLVIVGYFFRGENWQFTFPWNNNYFFQSRIDPINNIKGDFTEISGNPKIPIVLGRHEGCLYCHADVKGLKASHDPKAIGCYSCHLGNPFTIDKSAAHSGMILIPGNLAEAKESCGSAQCHPQIVERINSTIMKSMSGVVAVDKFVFNETKSLNELYDITNIGHSSAETHLRNLCASCHLGNTKIEWGEIDESSRGGGCNACHLNYSTEAAKELTIYQSWKQNKNSAKRNTSAQFQFNFHPSLSLEISNTHCFGCHSRSGRISTNYEGWTETQLGAKDVTGKSNFRVLKDDRVFVKTQADVHFEKGILCVDCHTSYEVMGDGNNYLHKEEQVKIQCTDCHLTKKAVVKTLNSFDYESRKIAELKNFDDSTRKYLTIEKSNFPLVNTSVDKNGKVFMIKRFSGESVQAKPPLSVCTEGSAHSDLSCATCHSSWAPQCIGCHTQFDKNLSGFDLLDNKKMKGEWIESAKDFYADPPTLGVKLLNIKNKSQKLVDNFIPGMILNIDKGEKSLNIRSQFKRLYAPAFSHTITKKSRSCTSCHNDPVAVGYGRGKLEYKVINSTGRWYFTPEYSLSKYDGLPEDAWIGFLKERNGNSTTRTNTRPFSIDEQKRILLVGACLSCHSENSRVMKETLIDFAKMKSKLNKQCVLPKW